MECMEKLTKKVLDRSEIRGFCGSKEQKPELHAYFCNTFDSKPHTVSHCPYSPPQLPHCCPVIDVTYTSFRFECPLPFFFFCLRWIEGKRPPIYTHVVVYDKDTKGVKMISFSYTTHPTLELHDIYVCM